jgi:hypothetical protein
MATRLQHPVHGFTHAYSVSESASLQSAGWKVCGEPAAVGKFEPPADAVTTPAPDAFTFAPEPAKRKPGRPPKAK